MEFRVCVISSVFLISLVQISTSFPAPKDNTNFVKSDDLIVVNNESPIQKVQDEPDSKIPSTKEVTIPGRVRCEYGGEEPVEDEDCQRHCIPKGFTYGLCFNNVCSCA